MRGWAFLRWYYHRGGERVGPIPGEEIRRLVTAGQLGPWEVLKAWSDARGKVRLFGSQAAASGRETSATLPRA